MRYILLLLLAVLSISSTGRPTENTARGQQAAPQAMCDAAEAKLRDTKTDTIALTLELDDKGRVHSFKTDSPKGLRLEGSKTATDEIKAMQFEPAKKNGKPVWVLVTVTFKCPAPADDASKH